MLSKYTRLNFQFQLIPQENCLGKTDCGITKSPNHKHMTAGGIDLLYIFFIGLEANGAVILVTRIAIKS